MGWWSLTAVSSLLQVQAQVQSETGGEAGVPGDPVSGYPSPQVSPAGPGALPTPSRRGRGWSDAALAKPRRGSARQSHRTPGSGQGGCHRGRVGGGPCQKKGVTWAGCQAPSPGLPSASPLSPGCSCQETPEPHPTIKHLLTNTLLPVTRDSSPGGNCYPARPA